ncbi:1,2-phenylacetyl-CoA epoxidase subunit PaaC [Streptomonospora litoralis]|uniref:1,2-phenylacetyl-CoA epoxidase, subunit C n=1 Tax=Streptomonospora litoralis TaxID=2498135 RepID=A0A4P6PYC7_9ACTN|nr:1,2-phenylacetyl-CoA epoxidase subunit PaaC [Streptomonospora litoralis]QBI51861.1 1,2-phenylacetyl-CoA epoxidase, subunit C [Streptomonospora litoralis]
MTHPPAADPPEESVYAGLVDVDGDAAQWAFGTGFDDPLAGVDTAVPEGVDRADLAAYCLMLGDDALVLSQRLAEWCSRAPELEEDVALANISLDLLGQARLLLSRAAAADPGAVPALPTGSPVPAEDALAFFRGPDAFRNTVLAELPNGDFAQSTLRLLLFSVWRLALLERLRGSADPVLAAVAAKGVAEVAYHRDYAARWTVTLARGTAESRRRAESGAAAVWPHAAELFAVHAVERRMAASGAGTAPDAVRPACEAVLGEALSAAGLPMPDLDGGARPRGRAGEHTEALAELTAEMQSLARAHPRGTW